MILTDEDLQRLRRLAEAATPGPWRHEQFLFSDGSIAADSVASDDMYIGVCDDLSAANYDSSDAAFIAAANPTVVLALLDWLAEARAERDVAERDRVLLRDEARLQISRADRASGQVAELMEQLAQARLATEHAEAEVARLSAPPVDASPADVGRMANALKYLCAVENGPHLAIRCGFRVAARFVLARGACPITEDEYEQARQAGRIST